MKHLLKFAPVAVLLAAATLASCTDEEVRDFNNTMAAIDQGVTLVRQIGCALDDDCAYYYPNGNLTARGEKLLAEKIPAAKRDAARAAIADHIRKRHATVASR